MGVNLDRTYEVIAKLNRAGTSQGICDALTSFTGSYGMTCMLAGTLPSANQSLQERHLLVSAYPAGWMDRYMEQNYAPTDPIIHRLKHDHSPFFWSEAAMNADGEHSAIARKMFGEAAEHNLRAGVALPVITLDGAIVGVSLGGDTVDIPPGDFGMISLISTFAIARAVDLRNSGKKHKRPTLTPREVECLKWAADGKTEWEISAILNISEHTADKHLANAHRKLCAANRAHAVALAIRWGFVS